jgi:catechol 2,3-dioxygenase-like lactoylglutathione lyase family enzyme
MTRPPRKIDHLVLAVHDLEDAADFYTRMGFQVGARNRHPWGTENRLIQFRTSFLELITVADAGQIPPHAPGFFSFGAFVQAYLTKREGLVMLALDSSDAAADAAQFERDGIAEFRPFSFERAGRQPDGTQTRVAFSLAFARDDRLPGTAFFACQQHHPEAFWNPLLQRHPNQASQTASITLNVENPEDHAGFLRAFTGTPPSRDGHHYPLSDGGQLVIQTRPAAPGFTGFSIGVADLDDAAQRLTAGHIPFRNHSGGLTTDADHCFGTRIDFTTETQHKAVTRPGRPA